MKKQKIYTPKEVRIELWNTCKKFYGSKGRNKTESKYIAKMRYMLFWLGMIKCKKKILDNWAMPDYQTIQRIEQGEKI